MGLAPQHVMGSAKNLDLVFAPHGYVFVHYATPGTRQSERRGVRLDQSCLA